MAVPSGLSEIRVRPGHPDFLDLPWERPLSGWEGATARLVQMPRGLSRHEVAFVRYEAGLYAVKALPASAAEREYAMLRRLEAQDLPAVLAVGRGEVRPAGEDEGTGVLVTRFLEDSLPYRTLFMQSGLERYRERLLDAMASLLVRLHLAGFYWGDCSLSNTLFRRDAGELQAMLVDAETSESFPSLSDNRRRQDLVILEENVTGELQDLAAIVELPAALGVFETGPRIRERYERLWAEVTREEVFHPSEHYRIHERIRALNALGFSVGEVSLVRGGDGTHVRMRAVVTDRDYHRHQLHNLTGLVAGDRQAALMLNEIREMRATLAGAGEAPMPMAVAAYRWLQERYEPAGRRLAAVAGAGVNRAELYCQVLEHKWYLSERAQQDVGFDRAIEDYISRFQGIA